MKQILFFAAFFLLAGVTVNAQSESKSCNKPCTHSEKASAQVDDTASKAMMAANKDENIKVKTCSESGKVSYYKKDVCENSGKVSYTQVEYQEATGTFAVKASNDEKVNAAPVKEAKKMKSSCGSKSASAKSGCNSASKASAKSDCKSKSASAKSDCSSSKASTAKASGKSCCSKPGVKPCSSKS